MKFKNIMILILICLFLISTFSGLERVYATRPHYIYDNANVIDITWENKINEFALKVDTNTTAEIVCITITKLDKMTIDEAREYYFNDVSLDGAKGIGKSGKDNGILIILAMEDRAWGIEVGYGLEGQLTDAESGRIGRDILTPKLKEDKTGEGLYNTVVAIAAEIGYKTKTTTTVDSFSILTDVILPSTLILGFIICIILIYSYIQKERRVKRKEIEEEQRSIRYAKLREEEEKRRQEEEERKKVKFFCPKCGKETTGKNEGEQHKETEENGIIYGIVFGLIVCLTCGHHLIQNEYKKQIDTVVAREWKRQQEEREAIEEEKRRRERRRREEREESYSSNRSSSSSSRGGGGGFGGGRSGGGGSSGRW